jgi:hypothetical protein
VLHRLLIAVIVNDARISTQDAVAYLKSYPEHVQVAVKVWTLIDDIRSMKNLKVFGISQKDVHPITLSHERFGADEQRCPSCCLYG